MAEWDAPGEEDVERVGPSEPDAVPPGTAEEESGGMTGETGGDSGGGEAGTGETAGGGWTSGEMGEGGAGDIGAGEAGGDVSGPITSDVSGTPDDVGRMPGEETAGAGRPMPEEEDVI